MTKMILSLAILASTTTAFAAPAKSEKKLEGSRYVFDALEETFPEFVEDIGGFSKEITIPQLSCFSANEVIADRSVTTTVCEAINSDFKKLRKPATNLFLVLLNQRMAIHNYSSPGITYIELKDVDCALIDPKQSDPSKPHEPRYECTVRQIK